MKKSFPLIFSIIFFLMNFSTQAQTPKQLAKIWDAQHITEMPASQVRHKDLRKYLKRLETLGLKVEEVGRSFQNREIYQIEFGRGKTRIFMWSQMHGDEPTATSALIDMFAFLQKNRGKNWVKNIEENLTIRAVPMLNPDGAEIYTRRNAQGIDINRDARDGQTPEGKLLKKLRDDWSPEIGFNLHNQQALTTVGETKNQATISLLVVNGDPSGNLDEKQIKNRRIASLMTQALNFFIKDNIARYDDSYNERAFGDNFSAWGTPVILVETGALHGRDENFLVKLNFVAYLTALSAIADGSYAKADTKIYENLPENGSGNLFNLIFRRANIFDKESGKIFVADIAVNAERRRSGENAPLFVREIGDLSGDAGLEEIELKDFYVTTKSGQLRVGDVAEFLLYKKSRKIDWQAQDFEKNFSPDEIIQNGERLKPQKNKKK